MEDSVERTDTIELAGTMEIHVNGELHRVPEGATLNLLLQQLELDPRVVAIECSGDVVPRASFAETVLKAGDRVEIVRFVQGG